MPSWEATCQRHAEFREEKEIESGRINQPPLEERPLRKSGTKSHTAALRLDSVLSGYQNLSPSDELSTSTDPASGSEIDIF